MDGAEVAFGVYVTGTPLVGRGMPAGSQGEGGGHPRRRRVRCGYPSCWQRRTGRQPLPSPLARPALVVVGVLTGGGARSHHPRCFGGFGAYVAEFPLVRRGIPAGSRRPRLWRSMLLSPAAGGTPDGWRRGRLRCVRRGDRIDGVEVGVAARWTDGAKVGSTARRMDGAEVGSTARRTDGTEVGRLEARRSGWIAPRLEARRAGWMAPRFEARCAGWMAPRSETQRAGRMAPRLEVADSAKVGGVTRHP